MNSIAKIFKERLIQNYLSKFSKENVVDFERKWKRIRNWRKSCIQGDLEHTKEIQIQGAFFVQIFDEILGYSTVTSTDSDFFNQKQEFNSILDATDNSRNSPSQETMHTSYRDMKNVDKIKDHISTMKTF